MRGYHPSHEVINGRIFSISGNDPRYPKWTADMEGLTHDYNCGHSVAIYHEGLERVFRDPLEGTGYSIEEARKAYSKQRRYENQIRKQKRTVEALKAAGLETREANAQLNAIRHRLKKHIDDNSAILRRERHREQLYDSAQRMKKKLAKMPAAPKTAHVSGNAFETAVQKVAVRGAGATVITSGKTIEHESIGAAKAKKKFKGPKLGKREQAILFKELRRYYKARLKGNGIVEYSCETVNGSYLYTVLVEGEDKFHVLRRRKID